jgi:hypothetical protein
MDKKDNAVNLDPNRFKMAKNMAVMPGGPMNNNPMNVTGVGSQPGALSGVNEFPYGDSGLQNDVRMGADVLNPAMVPHSTVLNNTPMGQKLNSAAPYGMQMQPGPNAEEPLEGVRLGETAMSRGLNTSQFMGPTGSAALMPGALDPTIPGGGTPLGVMPTMQQVDGGNMVPGSTPQKIQKKKGKK